VLWAEHLLGNGGHANVVSSIMPALPVYPAQQRTNQCLYIQFQLAAYSGVCVSMYGILVLSGHGSRANPVPHVRCVYVHVQAHTMPLAEPFESRLTRFQKLLVLRCLRPDRVLAGVQDFVAVQLGSRFIEPPPFDLPACFKESSPTTPLVFVLSAGIF
jgi:hypothetical protein